MKSEHKYETTVLIKEKAPLIMAEIKKAKSILLHCHPSPDPDSAGSALAMKFALESIGKQATVIKGDSDFPQGFMHFPGASDILQKNFFEIDLKDYDLFISQDTAALDRISFRGKVEFPSHLTVINIDHHKTNPGFGKIDLIETEYPATAQILFDLFKVWGIKFDRNIAANLFMGMYTDTGGFKYRGTRRRTFWAAAELVDFVPDYSQIIQEMENVQTPESMKFISEALGSIEEFHGGNMAMASISFADKDKFKFGESEIGLSDIVTMMRTVKKWQIVAIAGEVEPGVVKFSFRSKDQARFDVSKLAAAFGGGGHPSAAGVQFTASLNDAKKMVVDKAKELYNL